MGCTSGRAHWLTAAGFSTINFRQSPLMRAQACIVALNLYCQSFQFIHFSQPWFARDAPRQRQDSTDLNFQPT